MRRWFFAVGLLVIWFLSVPVRAQEQAHFSSVRVDLWPEYDRPALLVIYHMTLANGTALPSRLTLHIPATADIWAVAFANSTGGLVNAQYDHQVQGDWTVLTITAESLQIQVEYYQGLDIHGTARHIIYQWPGDAAVDAFSVNFLQPAGASNLVLVPASASSSMSQGLSYFHSAAMRLQNGQSFSLTADYQKMSSSLSISGMPIQPQQPLPQNSIGQWMVGDMLKILAGAMVGLIAVAGVIGLVVWQRTNQQTGRRKRRASADSEKQGDPATYCSQCGNRARPEDVFCRSCGARLRKLK